MKTKIFNAVCKTRYLALLVVLIFTCGNAWGYTYTRLESIEGIDANAVYVLGINGTGFHYSGVSSWGLIALPANQTPYYYTLTPNNAKTSFTARTTISNTTYYLQVPTSNSFSMSTSGTADNTTLIIGTTQSNAGNDKGYAVANSSTTTRHLRRNGDSGLRSYAGNTGALAFFYKVSCANPTSLTNGAIASSTAHLSWTDNTNTNCSYEIYCSTSSSTPASNVTPTKTVSTKYVDLTGLESSTPYNWWVRAKDKTNSAIKSDWVKGSNFTTTAAASYTVVWTINPVAGGTLSTTSGTSTTVTPNDAYTYGSPAYTVTLGSATVSQSTNTFTATPSANCTIRINMVEKPKYTVTLKDDNSTLTQASAGASITLPSRTGCDDYTFAGWTKSWTEEQDEWTTTAPTIIQAGSYTPTGNENLYPVYTQTKSGGSPEFSHYQQVALGGTITAGKYLISTGSYTMAGSGKTGVSLTPSTTEAAAREYTVAIVSGTTITIKGPDNKYIGGLDKADGLTFDTSTPSSNSYRWVYTENGIQNKSITGRHIKAYNTTDFRHYGTANGTLTYFYKRIETAGTTTYYISVPDCCTDPETALSITGSSTVAMDGTLSLGTSGGNGNTVTWSVATLSGGNGSISSSGVLTPSAVGTVTVTARQAANSQCAQEATLTVTITSATVNVTGVTVSPTTKAIVVGETFIITPTVSPNDATNKSVNWTSANGSIASVSSGTVIGVAAGGPVNITCTTVDGSFTASCATTVYSVTVQVKDEAGNTLSGSGKPTASCTGTTLSTAAGSEKYVFKEWQVSNAELGSSKETASNSLTNITGNVTVTAVYHAPITLTKGTNTGASTFNFSSNPIGYGETLTITCAADAGHKGNPTVTADGTHGAISVVSATSVTIANVQSAMTINISYTAKSSATVKLHVAGSTSTISGKYEGDSYTLPSDAAECPDMELYGWYTEDYEHATTAPSGAKFHSKGESVDLAAGDNDFYAVYAELNETANTYTKITTTDQLVTGDYLIVAYYSSNYIEAMANTVSEYDCMDEVEMKTFVNSTSNPTTINLGSDNPVIRWRITKDGSTVNFYNAAVNKYFSTGTGTPTLANSAEEFSYSVSSGKWSFVYDNTYLIYNTNYYVGNTEDKPIYLFKRDVTATNFTTSPSCTTHSLTVVADPAAGGMAEAEKTVLGETKTTTATATPNGHYDFAYWTISGIGSMMSNTSEGKSTDNPVTVTMGTEDATLTAHFTEKEKCTVVFKNNGTQISSTTYWLGENPVAPTLTDGTSGDACDATSDKHYGWTRNPITGSVPDQSTLDARTGLDVVYTKASTLPSITSEDNGQTLTYHAVWAQATGSGSGNYELVEDDLEDDWAGDYLIAYSSTIFADGRVGGKDAAGSIGAQSTHVTPGDNLSGTVVAASWGDKYYVTLEEISENSNTYVLKTQDNVYNYQSSNTNGLTITNNKATAANYPITVNYNSSADIGLALGGGASGAIFHYNTNTLGSGGDVFRYYKNGGQAAVYLYKKMGGTTYSVFLTTCCNKTVELSKGTLSHCDIAFSNDNPQTCSLTDSEREVTITVTPDAGYKMANDALLTFTPTDGDPYPTATYVSGPTPVGATYQFVYRFTKDDDGEGTFDATCTAKTYRITLNNNGATTAGTEYVDVVFNTAPANFTAPTKEGYNFQGYYTNTGSPSWGEKLGNIGGTWAPNITNYTSEGNWIRTDNATLYAKWVEKSLQNYRTDCPSFEIFNQDGTSAANIHLTSTKDVEIYSSEAAGNLIRIIASGLDANGNHPKIGVEYYDADNGDALVTGTDRVFRLSSSSTYNYEGDLLDLGENTTEYDQTFSICYIPKDYNQSHHYKLKLILRNLNTDKDNVTIHLYGRSLPKEFVIAAKSGETWYALPNTLAATEGAQGAITPTAIEVDNTSAPTKAVNPAGTVIYGACNKYTNDNRSGLRFTSDGAHWTQTSSTTGNYKIWLSDNGYTNAQDWYLKSNDLSAYEVFMDPIGSPSDKRRIELYNYEGVKMGYHNTGSTDARTGIGNIYLLPVEFPSMEAGIMEWGTDHVVIDLRTPGSSTKVKTQIGGGAIGEEQTLESVKKDEGVYRLAVSLSSSDALKDLKLYFYNSSDVLQGVAEFTIPRIVSSTTTTASFGTPFKKDAPFVDLVILNGATLTVSETTTETKFTFRDLYVYGGGKMVVPTGTYIDFSNVYLRGGHLDASWNYVYSHPQLVLNGTMGNTSNTINYDYLTNNAQFYSLALPYDVTLSTIVNPDFNNKQSWLIHGYDGAKRASGSQVAGWYDVEEGSTEGSISPLGPSDALTAGLGYTFFGAMQKVNGVRQKWSVNRFPMTLTSGSAEESKSGVSVTAHGMTDDKLNDGVAPNDACWNMLGNPFLADIGGTEDYETAVKGTILSYHNVKTQDEHGNWTGGWHWEENETNVRYVRIPNDQGTEYEQVRFKDATLRAFHHFFIQAMADGTFSFDLSMRAQSAPPRMRQGRFVLPDEMDVDFRLVKNDTKAKFGLTLSDDFSTDFVVNEDMPQDMEGESMKAYTLIEEKKVAFNGLPFTAAQQLILVGFRAPEAGEYVFSYIEDEDAEYMEHIYLTDKRLGVVTDLKKEPYKFASEIGVVEDRFALNIVFKSDVTTNAENAFEQLNNRPVKFIYQNQLYIMRNGIIYDALGRRVMEINN